MELVPNDESIEHTASTFQRIYNNLRKRLGDERSERTNLVVYTLILQNWKRLWKHLAWASLDTIGRLAAPVFLRLFLIWLEDYKNDKDCYVNGWLWGLLICLCPITLAFIHHRFFWLGTKIGYDMRMTMMALVHHKLFKLNSSTVSKITTGHVVNLVSNDVQRFDHATTYWLYILYGPIETLAAFLMVSHVLGIFPTISGFSCIFILIPLQSILSKRVAQYRKNIAEVSDKRISFLSELISGSLTVKMLSLEEPMSERVNSIRDQEHNLFTKMSYILGSFNAFYGYVQALMVTITFIVYRYTRGDFSVPDVFFTISLFSLPRASMGYYFLQAIQHLSETFVSTKRLDTLFKLSESETTKSSKSESIQSGEVVIENGDFGWYHTPQNNNKPSSSNSFENSSMQDETRSSEIVKTLSDVSLHIKPGELIGIVGKVGTGKSSLLYALLNEMETLSSLSCLKSSGTIGYCCQVPWILEGTVRENITFGKAFNAELYNQVVASCALEVDFMQFPFGDNTELGERGINISGGQKARISLARVAYSQADINLLDDPLSAVDPKVARILFEKCIRNVDGIMKNSTRLLVTHQIQFLPDCDRIYLLNNGKIECVGTWNKICTCGLLDVLHKQTSFDEAELTRINHKHNQESNVPSLSRPNEQETRAETTETTESELVCREAELIQKEHKELGNVSLKVYWRYITFAGFTSIVFAFLLLIMGKAFSFFTQWCVAEWASSSNYKKASWAWIIISTTFGNILTTSIASLLLFVLLIRGSTHIHGLMTKKVLHAPLCFFHTNPSGRILNRFSKDMGMQDDELPFIINEILRDITQIVGTLVLVCLALPYVVLAFPFFVYIFVKIRRRYVTTSREIKRYDGITRSPVYAMFSSNLKGLSTIRAFGRQADFHKKFLQALELNGSWWKAFLATSRWVAFRMDCVSSLVCVVSVASAIILSNKVSEEILGLALTYVIEMALDVQWFTRQTAELENGMTSVERNLEYTKLEQEDSNNLDKEIPSIEVWPVEGSIKYTSVTASYRTGLEPVLKDLSFVIPGRASIGIVGRTGSGKSSFLLTLFRLINIDEGQIFIDGFDVSALSINVLRRHLAIIPQDPTLFKGTLRTNLDPYNKFSDAQIWKALNQVHLINAVTTLGGLHSTILEGGGNLSVGQRQLLCLARAILLEAKILALDEATANVDHETDALVQESIRSLVHQKDKTVLIIAHRVDTILDCDYILVLDKGRKVEFGSPDLLLSQSESKFRSMVEIARRQACKPSASS
eukprot:g960.t1